MSNYTGITSLTATVSPFLSVQLNWTTSPTGVLTYTANGSFPNYGIAIVDPITVTAIGGGQAGGVGNGSAAPPNWGAGGNGGQYVNAVYLSESLTYPVQVTIGQGGPVTLWAEQSNTGSPGGTTYFGPTTPYTWYVEAFGGQSTNTSHPTVNGAQSYTYELGGVLSDANEGSTTNSGAAGGGSYTLGTGDHNPGVCSSGPGGNGGAQGAVGVDGQAGQNGANYGGGGGGSLWNGGSIGPNSGAGANGVLEIGLNFAVATGGYDIYRNGVFLGNTSNLTYVDTPGTGNYTYEVIPVVGTTETPITAMSVSTTVSVPISDAYGTFVGSPVFKATQVSQVGNIIPRIWPTRKNNTVLA